MSDDGGNASGLSVEQSKVLCSIRITTSTISFIASLAIVVMIARSRKKLSTTQNRLLTGLSVADMISSLVQSLTTIPFPKGYPGVWIALGNTTACDVQGFLYMFGIIVTPSYNASMCIYYLLKVRYNMSDTRIHSKVEPFLHFVPISIALTFCIYGVIRQYFNPVTSVCYLSDFPMNCTNNKDVPCERGMGVYEDWLVRFIIFWNLVVLPLTIFTTMGAIVVTTWKQERRMSRFGRGSLTSIRNNQRGTQSNRSQYVMATMRRALAYSGAWLITFIIPCIYSYQVIFSTIPTFALRVSLVCSLPLQGLFNFIVFIYPKVAVTMQMHPEFSTFRAFMFTVKRGFMTPEFRPNQAQLRNNSMIVRSIEEAEMDDVELALEKDLSASEEESKEEIRPDSL